MREYKIRIINQDSILVLASGQITSLAGKIDYFPLLILNRDELNAESIKALVDSGYYRRRFCEPATFDIRRQKIESLFSGNPQHATSQFELCLYGYNSVTYREDLITRYDAAKSTTEKRRLLEEYYDKKLSEFDIDRVCSVTTEQPPINHSFQSYIDKLDLSSKRKNKPYEPKLSRDQITLFSEQLPAPLRKLLNLLEAQFITVDNMIHLENQPYAEYLCGTNYTGLNCIALIDNAPRIIFDEEVVHLLDHYLGFSERDEWKEAVKKDMHNPARYDLLRKLGQIRGKADIRDGQVYSPEVIASEFLPEIFAADRQLFENFPTLRMNTMKNIFPYTYPLFLQFLDEIDRAGKLFSDLLISRDLESVTHLKQANWIERTKNKMPNLASRSEILDR